MLYKISSLLLIIFLFLPSARADDRSPSISLETAIKISNPDIVIALIYQREPLDSKYKEQLLDLAQNIIALRSSVIATFRQKTSCIPNQDRNKFAVYAANHSGFDDWFGLFCCVMGVTGFGIRMGQKIPDIRDFVREYRGLVFLGLVAFGYYVLKDSENHAYLEFLHEEYNDALAVKGIILRAPTIATNSNGAGA